MDSTREYDRQQAREKEIRELLRGACFALSLGDTYWGTGFFISPDLALTADHNVRRANGDEFDGFLGTRKIRLRWLKEWSSPEADIAVLRLLGAPPDPGLRSLPARYMDPLMDIREQEHQLARMRVALFGYSCKPPKALEEGYMLGQIDDASPLGWEEEVVGDGLGGEITHRVRKLSIYGNRRGPHLSGISGAPIYSFDWDCVIGVEDLYRDQGELVRGSALYEWLGRLLARGVDCTELLMIVKCVSGDTARPERGIAVMAGERDKPGTRVVPVTLRFGAGSQTCGDVAVSNAELREVAQSAVAWVGEYLRRFGGTLERVIRRNHWGNDLPYNVVTYAIPKVEYDPTSVLRAGMALAYISRILRDCLIHDLRLPSEFPRSLILCAAGFEGQAGTICGVNGLAHVVEHYPFQGPVVALYARSHQSELKGAIIPKGVTLVPVDDAAHMAQEVLACLLSETRTDAVRKHFFRLLADTLGEVLLQERELDDARLTHRGQESELADLQKCILVGTMEQDYLVQKIEDVRQKKVASETPPSPSSVIEEFGSLRDHWMAEAGLIALATPEGAEQKEFVKKCHLLWKRLAVFVHDDKLAQSGASLPEALQFTTLSNRKQDLIYMQGMEGALDPVGPEPLGPAIEDRVSAWFDRLFHLRSVHQSLLSRIEETRADVVSYGTEGESGLTQALSDVRAALRVQNSKVDALWWELRWQLGSEPLVVQHVEERK